MTRLNSRIAALVLALLGIGPATAPCAEPARGAASTETETPAEAKAVVAFWREAGPALWFAKDPEFDRRFRDRFLAHHEAAARGERMHRAATPDGVPDLVVLLDQIPRNAFRGTPRM